MISVAIAHGHKVTNFVLLLPNRPIRMMHLLDMTFWSFHVRLQNLNQQFY